MSNNIIYGSVLISISRPVAAKEMKQKKPASQLKSGMVPAYCLFVSLQF